MNTRMESGVWSKAAEWFTSVLFSDPPYKMVQPRLPAPDLQSAAHSKTSLKGHHR